MKKGCLILFLITSIAACFGVGFLFYDIAVAPRHSAQAFCEFWEQRLESINNPDEIPTEWNDTVYCRRFHDGWVMAAMYHGSCTQSGGKAFDASVYHDSDGDTIMYSDYSPCAGGIKEMGEFWESLSPADSFREYKTKFKDGPPKSG